MLADMACEGARHMLAALHAGSGHRYIEQFAEQVDGHDACRLTGALAPVCASHVTQEEPVHRAHPAEVGG
jgi:hypothetical protein